MPAREYVDTVRQLSDAGYRTSSAKLYNQPPGRKPVDGLEVVDGFYCPILLDNDTPCPMACVSKRTLIRHFSDHPIRPKPDPSACNSHVQTLFHRGGLQCYYSVEPSLSDLDPSFGAAYAYAVEAFNSLPKVKIPNPDHDKDRSSIHWFTRWPELLKDYIVEKESSDFLRSLISFPDPSSDPDWLLILRDHGCRWWNDAEAAHINCSDRASIMLKSHQQ
jgi:hypothetical protein